MGKVYRLPTSTHRSLIDPAYRGFTFLFGLLGFAASALIYEIAGFGGAALAMSLISTIGFCYLLISLLWDDSPKTMTTIAMWASSLVFIGTTLFLIAACVVEYYRPAPDAPLCNPSFAWCADRFERYQRDLERTGHIGWILLEASPVLIFYVFNYLFFSGADKARRSLDGATPLTDTDRSDAIEP